MIVLCTNDDGHEARGLGVLARAAAALGEVWTVAPDRAVEAGYLSVTPLHLDLTHFQLLATVSRWSLDLRQ